MELKSYFKGHKGLGVLSTADAKGRVNAAIYAEPHVIDKDRVAFIMADKLTRANLEKNPYAIYLFKEDGPKYKGRRLYLKKQGEYKDEDFVRQVCNIAYPSEYCSASALKGSYVLSFKVEKMLPLMGEGKKKD
jgi:hypothetical protein